MSKHEQGGPAFPIHPNMAEKLGCINSASDAGMTLRDYFAAKAMQGLLVADTEWVMNAVIIAIQAYEQADAMLVERTK